jgi:hypothetical protein
MPESATAVLQLITQLMHLASCDLHKIDVDGGTTMNDNDTMKSPLLHCRNSLAASAVGECRDCGRGVVATAVNPFAFR